jgi:hypothetical protein
MSLVAAGVLMGAPAAPVFAQSAAPRAETTAVRLVKGGSWRFTTRAVDGKGQPLCTEVWRFRTDGSATVESGAERMTKRWRAAPGEGGATMLYWQSVTTNGAPDCTGTATDPADLPLGESGFVVMFFNDGSAYLCNAPAAAANPDNTLSEARVVMNADCWGRIEAQPQG